MSFFKQVQFNSSVVVTTRWPDFKPLVLSKALRIQYVEYDDSYTIFAHDGGVAYTCGLIKLAASAAYPFANYTPDYDRTQNDTDVAEFEASYKSSGNSLVVASSSAASFVAGYGFSILNSRTSIMASTYTEPLTESQRSISSSSVSDAAAGTGARTVRMVYYDNTMAGPFTEDVTLNGTSNVNTVAANIRFIESIRVLTSGSGGGNAGTLSVFNATAGNGGLLASLPAGDNQTNWCHHYVGVNKSCFLSQVICGNQGMSSGNLTVLQTSPSISNSADRVVIPQIRVPAGMTTSVEFKSTIQVTGPTRLLLQVKQDSPSGLNNWFAGFSYQEA